MKKLFLICAVLVMNLVVAGTALGANVEVNTVKGNASDGSTGVYLAWNAFPGAASYQVLRSTDGNWNNATTFGAGASLAFDDKTVTNYVNYFYKIRALDAGNNVLGTSGSVGAFPPDTTAHGNFASNNDACGNCHMTHTGKSEKLTKTATTTEICVTCHDGTGSKYDSQNGKVKLSAVPDWGNSPAGPFGDLGRTGLLVTTTSTHGLGTAVNTAPGSNTTATFQLGCGSCHDPHKQVNYRLLRKVIPTSSNSNVPPITVEAYAQTTAQGESVNYVSGNVIFCGSCHSDFNQGPGSGHTQATSTAQPGFTLSGGVNGNNGAYMHAVNVPVASYQNADTNTLPLEGTARNVICSTCHLAHGTTVVGNSTRKDGTTSTVLKRAENMTVCEDCHKK